MANNKSNVMQEQNIQQVSVQQKIVKTIVLIAV